MAKKTSSSLLTTFSHLPVGQKIGLVLLGLIIICIPVALYLSQQQTQLGSKAYDPSSRPPGLRVTGSSTKHPLCNKSCEADADCNCGSYAQCNKLLKRPSDFDFSTMKMVCYVASGSAATTGKCRYEKDPGSTTCFARHTPQPEGWK